MIEDIITIKESVADKTNDTKFIPALPIWPNIGIKENTWLAGEKIKLKPIHIKINPKKRIPHF